MAYPAPLLIFASLLAPAAVVETPRPTGGWTHDPFPDPRRRRKDEDDEEAKPRPVEHDIDLGPEPAPLAPWIPPVPLPLTPPPVFRLPEELKRKKLPQHDEDEDAMLLLMMYKARKRAA